MKTFDKDNLPDDLTGLSFRGSKEDTACVYIVEKQGRDRSEWIAINQTTKLRLPLPDTGLRACIKYETFVLTRPRGWEFEEEEAPPGDSVQEVIEI